MFNPGKVFDNLPILQYYLKNKVAFDLVRRTMLIEL